MSELTNNTGNTGAGDAGATGATTGNNQGSSGAGNTGGQQGASGGGAAASWIDSLPPEYKENATIKGFKSVEDLAKSYIHAQGMIGADKIPVPGKQATDKDWEAVFTKLGRPEAADKYEVKAAEGHSPEFIKSFKETAFKSGLLPKQVEGIYSFYTEMEKKQQEAFAEQQRQSVENNIKALKQEWPDSEYDKNLGVAKTAVKNFLGEDQIKWLNESGLGNDPQMIKLMHKIGLAMSEDRLKGDGGVSFNEGRDGAQQKLNAILGDHKHPYFDASHPNHDSAVQEVSGYYQLLSKK